VTPLRTSRARHTVKAGFTVIEICIALVIMSLILANVIMVTRTGGNAMRAEAFAESLEDDLNLTLDRIKLALMASSATSLEGVNIAPLGSNEISYSISLGLGAGGILVDSDPEKIEWTSTGEETGTVIWTQNPDLAEERSVVWSNWVPRVHDDEIDANIKDDNGNGLNDENGLAFTLVEDEERLTEVIIHLTIERTNPNGKQVPIHRKVNITCRN
jgi:prepilin-type N-terminal cleavage/methylation domain-containing protein